MIEWNCSKEEITLISKIAKRAGAIARDGGIRFDYAATVMDLEACHGNGCPLDLQQLLDSKDSDFGHDVFGITRFINRDTGELDGHFEPRCAMCVPA